MGQLVKTLSQNKKGEAAFTCDAAQVEPTLMIQTSAVTLINLFSFIKLKTLITAL